MSPTQLSLRKMRGDEFRAYVVEHWNAFAKIRQDLFGFIDILGVFEGRTLAVQSTTKNNISARVHKIMEKRAEAAKDCLLAGWEIEVHGWHQAKKGAPWKCRVITITLDNYGNLVAEDQ